MAEKRFEIIKTKTYGLYVPVDKMKVYNFSSFESELDCIRVVKALNDLEEKSRENGKIASKYLEENEQLKQQSDNKQKHIVTLENKIVRMRKAIHKLEWLSTHRNADLQRENEQLKQEVTHWKKILDNHQQIVAKTLREQYHWLKNEDKISNHDKTVALLELESISARLGIDLN